MTHRSDTSDGWTWQQPIGLLRCGPLAGQVDVAQLHLGVHRLQLNDASLDGRLLGVVWGDTPRDRPPQVTDSYLRAGDLVASYQPRADWPYSPQVYWRAESIAPGDAALAALTLWVSIETDRLDTHPTAGVESCLPADALLHLSLCDDGDAMAEPVTAPGQWAGAASTDIGGLLWRLPGGRVSCAQFARTGDVQGLQLRPHSSDDATGRPLDCRWMLFADFLEKGVIRRSCLQTVLVEREDDVVRAAECWRQFQSRPLPLAT